MTQNWRIYLRFEIFSLFLAKRRLGSCHFSIQRDLCYDNIHSLTDQHCIEEVHWCHIWTNMSFKSHIKGQWTTSFHLCDVVRIPHNLSQGHAEKKRSVGHLLLQGWTTVIHCSLVFQTAPIVSCLHNQYILKSFSLFAGS